MRRGRAEFKRRRRATIDIAAAHYQMASIIHARRPWQRREKAEEVLVGGDDHVSKGVLQYQEGDFSNCRFAAPNTSLATMATPATYFASPTQMTDVVRAKIAVTPRRCRQEVLG